MKKVNSIFYMGLLTVISLIYILIFPFETAFYTKSALKVCAYTVIPSLFLFMVFNGILSRLCSCGFMSGKMSLFFSRFLGLPVCLVPVCISGCFCGAPSCTLSICKMYSDGFCTKEEAESACILTGNCSAAFIMGVVSANLASKVLALYILIANLCSAFTVYFLFYRTKRTGTKAAPLKKVCRLSEIITESITSAADAAIRLSAYVVFFYTVGAVVSSGIITALQATSLSNDFINTIRAFICSLFEIGLGTNSVQHIQGTKSIIVSAFAVSFTGISIIFQVTDIMRRYKLPVKDYIFTKAVCALLCPVYVILILLLTPFSVPVFSFFTDSTSQGVSISDIAVLLFITATAFTASHFLTYLDKKHKK